MVTILRCVGIEYFKHNFFFLLKVLNLCDRLGYFIMINQQYKSEKKLYSPNIFCHWPLTI